MKRAVAWWLGVSGIGVGLVLVSGSLRQGATTAEAWPGKKKSDQAAATQPAQAGNQSQAAQPAAGQPAQPGAEKIVYTFEDEAKMREFTRLWQQRQGIVLRMSVLQGYWNGEQAALAQMNKKLGDDYKLDPLKNYTLDGQKRVLIEREAPPAPAATATPAASPSGQAQAGQPNATQNP